MVLARSSRMPFLLKVFKGALSDLRRHFGSSMEHRVVVVFGEYVIVVDVAWMVSEA